MLSRTSHGVVAVLDALAERRSVAILICAALAFTGSAVVAICFNWPMPAVHDEFSYLLAADTFASGRLTNPTHEFWHHFETFYVLQEPTYASRFPPAQGLVLALGIVLGSTPVLGLWLSAAAMAGSFCWALYGFVSARWAFLTGLAVVCQIGIATYWTQSFWGGAAAATGSALLFGSSARLLTNAKIRDAVVLGVGLVLLANSRPFEGALSATVPALFLLGALFAGRLTMSALWPAVAVIGLGAVLMAGYNRAVVGDWRMLPYFEYENQYAQRPVFAFQGVEAPKVYRHDELQRFFRKKDPDAPGGERRRADTEDPRSRATISGRLARTQEFFAGRTLMLPLVVGAWVCWRSRVGRLAALGMLAAGAALFLSAYFRVHYVAPAAAPIYAITAIGFERLANFRRRNFPIGGLLCAILLAGTVLSLAVKVPRLEAVRDVKGFAAFASDRARVVEALHRSGGKHLVLVSYDPAHNLHREWVFNRADIDDSEIVWARDMGDARNASLLAYFADRTAWKLRIGPAEEVIGPSLLVRGRTDSQS